MAAKGLLSAGCVTGGQDRACSHTVRRLAKRAPRRIRLCNDIAKAHPPVKNKVRT